MNNSYIYQNSERIEKLIEELKYSPRSCVRVPIGRRPIPLLDRLLLTMTVFCISFFVLLFPMAIFFTAILFFVESVKVVSIAILFDTLCALVISLIAFSKYKMRQEFKRTRIEDLSYFDLARMIAFEDRIDLNSLEEEEEEIDPSQIDNATVEGVIYWMKRIKGEGEIYPGSDSYQSIENSIKYLEGIQRHGPYRISASILEGISKTLEYYDKLVSEEIPTEKVLRVLRKIESVFPEYERACKELYEQSIDNELLETEVHIEALTSQLELNGLKESDFKINTGTDDRMPPDIRY